VPRSAATDWTSRVRHRIRKLPERGPRTRRRAVTVPARRSKTAFPLTATSDTKRVRRIVSLTGACE
jgi:hypothetical protein